MLNDAVAFEKIYIAVGYTDLRRGLSIVAKHLIEEMKDPPKTM